MGDGFDFREEAQKMNSQLGKVLRLREDGAAPTDNPYNQAPYVYSIGHRNPQGLVIDETTGIIYELEHGPAGGDEINTIEAGLNYGWPVVTLGVDYSGASISPFNAYPGMQDPKMNWTPSIAPSSMVMYSGNLFPFLNEKLLVTALKGKAIYAVDVSVSPAQSQRVFATIDQRLRDIAVDDDGAIYVLTDGEDATVLKIEPVTL